MLLLLFLRYAPALVPLSLLLLSGIGIDPIINFDKPLLVDQISPVIFIVFVVVVVVAVAVVVVVEVVIIIIIIIIIIVVASPESSP